MHGQTFTTTQRSRTLLTNYSTYAPPIQLNTNAREGRRIPYPNARNRRQKKKKKETGEATRGP